MEGVRTFLESSTIHGLGYIPITRKYARLFWILTVLGGFSTAGYLIQQSFQSWAESPVKTTVETLPISEITFPKITVCPPRNTFTDLNYDLMAIENVSLDEPVTELDKNETVEYEYDFILGIMVPINGLVVMKTKNDELREFASEVINDHLYMDDWMMLEEQNRFYNWYHGFTKIIYPKFSSHRGALKYTIDTIAISGVITTKDFGKKFDSLLLDSKRNFEFNIKIFPPENIQNNTNVTLHLKVERFGIGRVSRRISDSIMVSQNPKNNEDGKSVNYYTFNVSTVDSGRIDWRLKLSHYNVNWILQLPPFGLNIEEIGRIKQMPGKKV